MNPNFATLLKTGKTDEIQTALDPDKDDHYRLPDLLWEFCRQGGDWLPPLKNQDWKPLDI